jgi:hypothetical protein
MQKRVLLAALAAAALVVAPVAGSHAKQDGDGGSKKCEKKTKSVGFKVRGAFDGFVDTGLGGDLTVAVDHANRHASDWLGVSDNTISPPLDATFPLDGDERIKFIGVTDNPSIIPGAGTIGIEDAVTTDRVKLKAKLEQLKHGCPPPPEEDAVLEGDTELSQVSTEPDVKKVKVKRADTAETD